jgi:hypothetical protein
VVEVAIALANWTCGFAAVVRVRATATRLLRVRRAGFMCVL